MGFFDDEDNVQDYIHMADGFDGRELIEIMKRYVPAGSSVLELGMGPGKDLDILKENYQATGSDSSDIFLERYRSTHMDADLLNLDAVTLETQRSFDALYSNKVLMHLSRDQLVQSLDRQEQILNSKGIVFHSFWEGDHTESIDDLLFIYYRKDELVDIFGKVFKVLEVDIYTEMEPDDSVYIIAQKQS
jgi:hypothetical protein